MSVEQVPMHRIVCDGCGATFEWYDEGVDALFDTASAAEKFVVDGDWTMDGEGKHHCEGCETLELTEAAKAEQARQIGPNDVPLIEAGA